MTPDEEIARGQEARRVLTNKIYLEAYDTIRDRIWSQLALAETDNDKRIRLNSLAIALESVRKYMKSVMEGGKMAADQIERDRTLGERIKQGMGL